MAKRNTTLSEVAKAAGVSTAAVAKVMYNSKGNTRVSREKAELIRKIASEMNLTANPSARALRTGKTKMIGFLSGGSAGEIRIRTMTALTELLEAKGYRLISAPSNHYENTHTLAGNLAASCDAVVVDASFIRGEFPEVCADKLLLLTSDENAEKSGYPMIRYGHSEGVREAINYLYGKGHRKIVMFAIDWWNNRDNSRVRTFEECTAKLGFDYAPIEHLADSFEEITVEQVVLALKKHQQATAVFCVCDRLAMRVIQAAKVMNIKIPQELSVMGFDDIFSAELTTPALTTVRQPCHEVAVSAANYLMNKLENADNEIDCAPPCRLVVRESVDIPRK